jgi:hypothetical protein
VPEEKKPAAKPSAAPTPALARASESGDPAVHQLLAELQTARSNSDAAAVKAATERLAALGYE